MTATTTTMPRRPLAPWVSIVTVAILVIAVLAASGVRLTWDAPIVTIEAQQTAPDTTATTAERAGRLVAARHELAALRVAVGEVPALQQSMHDRMQLLAAVSSGHVPIEALERPDDPQLRKAVHAGQVPTQALDPQ